MADDNKLKQELLYMATLTSRYDFSKMEVVEGILRLENERKILDSVFGRRFKARIFDIGAGVAVDDKCVLCGKTADNHVICNHCMETILGSDYAKNKIKIKESKRFKIPELHLPKIKLHLPDIKLPKVKLFKEGLSTKSVLLHALAVCLTMILFIQIWILYLLYSIPEVNPVVKAKVSENEPVSVAGADAAYSQLLMDFPEEQGYTITYARNDVDYVGRFLLDKGECCEEVEEQLTDEERYDYFFTEPVYIFYISNIEDFSSRIGMAEVNEAGNVLIKGAFNDGRRTDSFYKYR